MGESRKFANGLFLQKYIYTKLQMLCLVYCLVINNKYEHWFIGDYACNSYEIHRWNTLLDEIHYWMKYITGWNILLDEIHHWMKYITWWNTLLYEIHYVMKVSMLYLIYCVFVIKHAPIHKILFWNPDYEIWLLLMVIFWSFSWGLCWDVPRSLKFNHRVFQFDKTMYRFLCRESYILWWW